MQPKVRTRMLLIPVLIRLKLPITQNVLILVTTLNPLMVLNPPTALILPILLKPLTALIHSNPIFSYNAK